MTSPESNFIKRASQTVFQAAAMATIILIAAISDGYAFSNVNNLSGLSQIDDWCTANNRLPATPYDGDCYICHQGGTLSGSRDGTAVSAYRNGDYAYFCPGFDTGTVNQPPDGMIVSPADGAVFDPGPVTFDATGSDPEDGNAVTCSWNFGGSAANATGCTTQVTLGNTTSIQRSVTVTLTVRDSQGLPDPTPDSITVRINPGDTGGVPPTACTDDDGDGFSPEGAYCGPVDSEPLNAAINPGVYEVCDDNIDNDGDGLLDLADEECQSCDNRSPVQLVLYGECRFANAGGGGGGTGGGGTGTGPSIRTASWESGDGGKLKLTGRDAPGGATVQVANADTNDIVATVVASSNGEWQIEKTHIGSGPCRVKAGVNGVFGDPRDVQNAPADCIGGVGTPGENAPVIRGANWRADESALRVSGGYDFAPGTEVTVFNADTGSVVGTTNIRDDGEFRFKAEGMQPDQVPCRVKVEVGGQSSNTAHVDNAPANCDDGTPGGDDGAGTPGGGGAGTGLSIAQAVWWESSLGGMLRVVGTDAPGGATVQVVNADTNDSVGTAVVSSDGRWTIVRRINGPWPCRVKAGVNGVFGNARDVQNAPSDCVGSR